MTDTPKERPIIFSGPMIRALIAGTKTQTRRVVKPQPYTDAPGVYADAYAGGPRWAWWLPDGRMVRPETFAPYACVGDVLWVREAHALIWPGDYAPERDQDCRVEYRADGEPTRLPGDWPAECGHDPECPKWRPSIYMPRWACRLRLRVTGVRIERLQHISEDDARAEGVMPLPLQEGYSGCWWTADVTAGAALHRQSPRDAYHALWDSIHGKRAPWASNPWVWVVTFEVMR